MATPKKHVENAPHVQTLSPVLRSWLLPVVGAVALTFAGGHVNAASALTPFGLASCSLLASPFVIVSPSADPSSPVQAGQGATSEAFLQARRSISQKIDQGRFREAAKAAEKLARKNPAEAMAWLILANCHLQDTWAMRKDQRAEFSAEKALELGGRQPVTLYCLAMAKYRQRKYDEAFQLIGELVDVPVPPLDPARTSNLLVSRAQLVQRHRALEEDSQAAAHRDLSRALKLVPNHTHALTERAGLAMDQGKFEAALQDLLQAIKIDPGGRTIHWRMKTCYARLGNVKLAKHHMEVSKRMRRLDDSLASQSAPDEEESLKLLRELKQLNPKDQRRRIELAYRELQANHLDQAAQELQELRAEWPHWTSLSLLQQRIQAARESQAAGVDSAAKE